MVSKREYLDTSLSPNVLNDIFTQSDLGTLLSALPTSMHKKVPAASTVQLGTLQAVPLPNNAKANTILRAYARTATAGQGELTVVAYGATPATGEIAVAPNGDLVTLAADAITLLDAVYLPEKGQVKTATLPVVSNEITLPSSYTDKGAVLLISANVTAVSSGSATGTKIVVVPGGTPAAGQAALTADKTKVAFAAADNVTEATVTVLIAPEVDLSNYLESDSSFV